MPYVITISATMQTVTNIHYHTTRKHLKLSNPPHKYNTPAEAQPYTSLLAEHALAGQLANHDYEEPYFEPASRKEEILMQLRQLGVPVVPKEALK